MHNMDSEYYQGEEDYQQLQKLPEIERETELMEREERVKLASEKIDLMIEQRKMLQAQEEKKKVGQVNKLF